MVQVYQRHHLPLPEPRPVAHADSVSAIQSTSAASACLCMLRTISRHLFAAAAAPVGCCLLLAVCSWLLVVGGGGCGFTYTALVHEPCFAGTTSLLGQYSAGRSNAHRSTRHSALDGTVWDTGAQAPLTPRSTCTRLCGSPLMLMIVWLCAVYCILRCPVLALVCVQNIGDGAI